MLLLIVGVELDVKTAPPEAEAEFPENVTPSNVGALVKY
jgi:hypothetical protein